MYCVCRPRKKPVGSGQIMEKDYLRTWSEILRGRGVALESGLSDEEVLSVETRYGFRLPPDLRGVLQYALPLGKEFPNWRHGEEEDLRKRLSWPLESLCFDVEHNVLWLASWGPRPPDVGDAVARCQQLVADAPPLVPIFSHRYIPSEPFSEGNPVLSVYQSDIIYMGNDLADYFHNEFHVPRPSSVAAVPGQVRFWDEIVQDNNRPFSSPGPIQSRR
jgi:hypothetical protein